MYNLDKNKVFIVSNGSLTAQIPYIPPKSERPLTVLYAGSAMKAKDIDKLVQAIANLTEKGLKINLCVAGIRLIKLPQWVQVLQYNWPDFVERVLTRSDICVIPYPPNKFLFNNSVPAKLFDYMAAGKPIVSTNLNGVRSIIENFDCGLIAKDWNEFEFFLAKLYHNIPYAVELGKNGRTTAEKHFDYELIAKSLLIHIINIFK
jgi:glycosyltransferase involved in cell wall biosynthesis